MRSQHLTLGSHLPRSTSFTYSNGLYMPYKALSERVKRQDDSKLKEEKILQAVEAYRVEQTKPEPQKGARTIAKEYGVEKAYKTIINRYNDGRSIREAHEEQQKLTAHMHVKSDRFGRSTAWSHVFAPASNDILFKYLKNHL